MIEIEPMGNMPVLKDLIVDMDAVHWKKVQRVTPWLLAQAARARARVPRAAREHGRRDPDDGVHPVRRLRVGLPGDGGRPGLHRPGGAGQGLPLRRRPARLRSSASACCDLAEDPQGIYDCTHCFKCVEACPKDVNPMGQIMRLRRIAGVRPAHRRPQQRRAPRGRRSRRWCATTDCCTRRSCCRAPTAGTRGSANSTRAAGQGAAQLAAAGDQGAAARGRSSPKLALFGHKIPKPDLKAVQAIYETVEERPERYRAEPVREPARTKSPRPGCRVQASGAPVRRRGGAGRQTQRRRRGARDEGRLLARLREPRLHPRAARLDGEGRAAAGHRAGRARPRLLHAARA